MIMLKPEVDEYASFDIFDFFYFVKLFPFPNF